MELKRAGCEVSGLHRGPVPATPLQRFFRYIEIDAIESGYAAIAFG